MFDWLGYFLLAGIGLFLLSCLSVWCYKRYEIAVFLVSISPWISAIFFINNTVDSIKQEATLGSYIRISLLIVVGLIGAFKFIINFSQQRQNTPLQVKLLAVFLGIALVSTSYSLDPFYTFVRSVSFVALYGFLLGLYVWLKDSENIDKVIQSIFYVVVVIALANFVSLLLMGDLVWWVAEKSRFSGLWGHPNMMGAFSMISYPVVFWKYSRTKFPQKLLIIALMLILAVLQILTGSRTSILAASFGISLWFLLQRKRLALIALLIGLAIGGILIFQSSSLSGSFERDTGFDRSLTTLTGRTEFWSETLSLIKEKPLTGYGFGIAGKILSESDYFNPDVRLWSGSTRSSLHNGYISIFSGVGIVGFLLWCAILILPIIQARQMRFANLKALALAILATIMLVNFVEDAINPGSSFGAVLFWITWIMVSKMAQNSPPELALDQSGPDGESN